MRRLPSGTLREIAKYCLDMSKLTATAAFITPCFTAVNIEPHIIIWMATAAIITFIFGIALNYIIDHLETQNKKYKTKRQNNIQGKK